MADYTFIPEHYFKNYKEWFSPDTIRTRFNGNILSACESHPVYFAYYLLGVKCRDYQIFMIDMMLKNRYLAVLCGRRLGKSMTNKIFALWNVFYNKKPTGMTKTTKVIVIAHTADAVEDYITEIDELIENGDKRVFSLFKGKLGANYFTSKKPKRGTTKAKDTTTKLSLYNNGWNTIQVYPPTPKVRGKAASIIMLDELASWYKYTTDEHKIYGEAVRPVISDNTDTKIFWATTPEGSTGLAYELFPIDGHKTIYEKIWFPYYIRQDKEYLDEIEKIKEEYASLGKSDAFRQEYLAEFVNASRAFFDNETETSKVFSNTELTMRTRFPLECDMAIDFGGMSNSRTVITISRLAPDNKCYRLFHKRYELGKDATLQQDILGLLEFFPNIRRFHVDNQGGGSSFYSWFRNTFGSSRIDEVSFKGEKVNMYSQFKIACFQDRVKSYYDPVLLDEFNSFTNDRKPMKNKTDDCLDSFVMSIKDWLVKDQSITYGVISY